MKKIGIYIIMFILVIIFRDNICFFYGNVLGVFKLDNNYYDGIITLKDEKIEYLENEIDSINEFSKNLDRIDYSYKISKIIYKESYNKDNGVENGMGVTNEFGFIGKITKVDNKTSELTTIKDLKDLSVVVNDSYGKLNYDYETNTFTISDISNYDKVYVNDLVYTSGYGSIKEKVLIGKVVKVDNSDISKKIVINTVVDFNNLNYVLIVGDSK